MEIISSSYNLILLFPGDRGALRRKLVEQEELLQRVRPERPKLLTTFTTSRSKHEKVPTLVDRGIHCRGGHSSVKSNGVTTAGQKWPESANNLIGKDQMLLAQADTSGQKKTHAGKKHPLVNVDKNGVILKGYDPVAYFKQSKAVKGNPKYSSKSGGAT